MQKENRHGSTPWWDFTKDMKQHELKYRVVYCGIFFIPHRTACVTEKALKITFSYHFSLSSTVQDYHVMGEKEWHRNR